MTRAIKRMPVAGFRASVALGLAIFLVAVGSTAGIAAWTASASKSASVTSARVAVSSTGLANLAVVYKPGLPGPASASLADVATVSVSNTGTAPLSYSLATSGGDSAFNQSVTLQVWRGTGCTTSTAVPTGTATGTLAAPPALPADANSAAAGASLSLCMRTSVTGPVGYAGGGQSSPTVSVVGAVGDNWTAAASAAFTQSAGFNWFELRHKSSGKCLDVNGGGTPAAGAGIIIYTCKSPQTALGNQSFRFAQDANGAYRVYPGSGSPANTLVWAQTGAGTAVRLAAVSTADAQQWTVVAFGATGEYRVMSRTGSLCLTQSSNAEAGAVTAAACAANSTATNAAYLAQRFTFTEIAS